MLDDFPRLVAIEQAHETTILPVTLYEEAAAF